ncbi:serine/threonine-protein kinase RAD53 [Aspergillus lentulus]|uniref:serine/threonine-protein kinase RAD53 n=1 Tax=Aspergillus lentulus TaxID=293939 RepID=UPI001394B73D|nr:serine/threonine-protein kinase RAD53 [Aspergillus lentulus]GFF34984.1 serine/threonine-protein kinase RAD53 [Aspergillus lentulus]
MADDELVQSFKLDITFVGGRRRQTESREARDGSGQAEENISLWARQEYLVKDFHVFLDKNVKTQELRVVKKIMQGDWSDWMSEVKIMGMVTKATKKQGKELFVEFLGWYPGKDYIGLVMEYCRYGDVSRCFPGPLSEEKAWTLCSQLLEGLQILHGMGITHRDIKPQNILVVQKDPLRVKIADFGISKRISTKQTNLKTRVGTDGYRAPEILSLFDSSKRDSLYTSAVDIWSLGCVLYYALTKDEPFPSPQSLENYLRGSAFPEDTLIERGVGASGRQFIISLMAPLPENRRKATLDALSDWTINNAEEPIDGADEPPQNAEGEALGLLGGFSIDSPASTVPRWASSHYTPPIQPQEDMELYSLELWHILKSAHGPIDRLRPLLDAGAKTDKPLNGYTALHLAAKQGSPDRLQILLSYGSDLTVRTQPHRETALHLITYEGDFELFEAKYRLLRGREGELDINARDVDGNTALHLAVARFGTATAVKLLLEAGDLTELKDKDGLTPLLYALSLNQWEKASILLEFRANPNAHDQLGWTALHHAVASRRCELQLLERLIQLGAALDTKNNDNLSPLALAAKLNKKDVMYLLIDHGANCELGFPALEKQIKWALALRGIPWPIGEGREWLEC